MKIPFNKPAVVGDEIKYINDAIMRGQLSGDGYYTKMCRDWFVNNYEGVNVLLTPSCTDALEMTALLLNITDGDEVIMPSFTFVSTANAFVLRGAKPIFVDIREDTLNIDEQKIEKAISNKTKAIVVVHYGGVSCEMNKIMELSEKYNIPVIEDAAHALGGIYKGKLLGTIGAFGTFSFHETKNLHCGEGGALAVNDLRYLERAEIIREKGTDRSKFLRGQVDKYTWVDIGSSFVMSELQAAYLYAQLEGFEKIKNKRKELWHTYYNELFNQIPIKISDKNCYKDSSYHIFYGLAQDLSERTRLLEYLKSFGILAVFHYVPLHTSVMSRDSNLSLSITEDVCKRLFRLPLYYDLEIDNQKYVIKKIIEFFQV